MRGATLLSSLLFLSLPMIACESAVGPGGSPLSADDARRLASELDVIGNAAIDGALVTLGASYSGASSTGSSASGVPVPVSRTFTRTLECPKGGQVTVVGTTTGEGDRETRTLTTESKVIKTHVNCAVGRRNGLTITMNGSPNIVVTATRKIVAGRTSGPQTLSQKGAFTYATSDGRSGSCAIDLTSTFDPDTRTYTLKGVNCGRTVDLTRTRGG